MIKSVLIRFFKGMVAGAITQMSIVTFTTPHAWSDFYVSLDNLLLAAATGAMTGLLLGFQKWASWKE